MNDFLKIEDILSKLKINESDLKKMIEEGKFPPPERKNNGFTIWSYATLEYWIKNKNMENEWLQNNDLDFL
tara:strand:+ start:804 stop:1016 length:213 start_codon:yes stop_codon:yes gene_type:complete